MDLPTVLNMLVAEGVHRDSTGKHYLLGVYDKLAASTFPLVLPRLNVYCSFAGGSTPTALQLRLLCVEHGDSRIGSVDFAVPFAESNQLIELVLTGNNVKFNHPGEYRLQIFQSDKILCERRLLVAHQVVGKKAASK